MATNTIIKPSVGRKIWCFGSAQHWQDYQKGIHEAQPHDGTVLFVHDDRTINVKVIDHNGESFNALGLALWQEGDPEPNGAHARWMPYQTKQQAKQDIARESVGTVSWKTDESGVPPVATQDEAPAVNSDPSIAVPGTEAAANPAPSTTATNLGSKL